MVCILIIALKVGCGILSDKEIQFLIFEIFRLIAIFGKKVFNVSAILPSSMTISPFFIRTFLSEFLGQSEKQNSIVFFCCLSRLLYLGTVHILRNQVGGEGVIENAYA